MRRERGKQRTEREKNRERRTERETERERQRRNREKRIFLRTKIGSREAQELRDAGTLDAHFEGSEMKEMDTGMEHHLHRSTAAFRNLPHFSSAKILHGWHTQIFYMACPCIFVTWLAYADLLHGWCTHFYLHGPPMQ